MLEMVDTLQEKLSVTQESFTSVDSHWFPIIHHIADTAEEGKNLF